jgi:hypothetical protein
VPLSDCNNMMWPLTCNTRAMHTHTRAMYLCPMVPEQRSTAYPHLIADIGMGRWWCILCIDELGLERECKDKHSPHALRTLTNWPSHFDRLLRGGVTRLSRADPERATLRNRRRWGVMNRAGTEVVCGRALVENAGRFVSG